MTPTVAELLAASRAAHQRYRDQVPRMGPNRQRLPGDVRAAGAALLEACRLRVEARAIDPERRDPAWRDEPATHDDDRLLTFYAEQLSQ